MKFYTIVYVIVMLLILVTDHFLYKQSKKGNNIQKAVLLFPTFFYAISYTLIKLFGEQINDYRFNFFLIWFNLVFIVFYITRLIQVVFGFYIRRNASKKTELNSVKYMIMGAFYILIFFSAFVNPAKIDVKNVTIKDSRLPSSFRNFRIVQISDLHLGSRLNSQQFFGDVVDVINKQNADIVVLTGDIVNNYAGELDRFIPVLSGIKARSGKYAILGNHDYGDYSLWPSDEAKADNLNRIRKGIEKCGFQLLENTHVFLKNNKDSVALIGVGNYRDPGSDLNYTDMPVAVKGLDSTTFKILLTHNPLHWPLIKSENPDINVLLCGHTHSGQFGLKIHNKVYSPAVFIYPDYSGLYQSGNQQLYVNGGLGYIGLPMIVGIHPEVSVITLDKN